VARKVFFTKEIRDLIRELLTDNHDLNFIKTIESGSLEMLPSPEYFNNVKKINDYFPALLIEFEELENFDVDETKRINTTEYMFNIQYLKYYDQEVLDMHELAEEEAGIIADTLQDDNHMKTFEKLPMLFDKFGTPVANILYTNVGGIIKNQSINEVLKEFKIPLISLEINFCVTVRTLYV
jgi:hypothetical protein